jgi:hypothetical protein
VIADWPRRWQPLECEEQHAVGSASLDRGTSLPPAFSRLNF